jgi:flagellar motor protein MotB
MGADKPIAENSNAEGRANNRRVEIVILKAP